jgi:peptide/nickel transport system ATP-binding protein
MKENTVLELRDYTLSFDSGQQRITALKGLNLSIEKGKTLGLVGESGSGKSLTSLSIMGLLPPIKNLRQEGEILFRKKSGEIISLTQLSTSSFAPLRGSNISMVFQEPMSALNPVMRCGEQVAEVLSAHESIPKKQAREKVLAIFDAVKLPDPQKAFDAWPHELSGGQRQRIVIAMAIVASPSLIIADEPTTALDVTVQRSILTLLKGLQEEMGLSMLFISHDLGVIAEIAHHTAVMLKGEIVEQGKTEELLQNPQHAYTKGLIACKPPLNAKPHRLMTVASFMQGENSSPQKEEKHIQSFAEQGNEKLLEVKNIQVYYKNTAHSEFHALKNISMGIQKGESVGLVGESGCGKSTLGRSIIGLNSVREGEIFYKGRDLLSLNGTERKVYSKNIQLIFQDPFSSLNPLIRIGEAIEEPLKVHFPAMNAAARKERVIQLLQQVGLNESHYQRYPHEFSGGQRQRIVIARALSVEPELIICDESVAALDVSIQAQILNLLNDLKDQFGFTYLFISHDLSVVKYFCDRVYVMKKGEIVESGLAESVFNQPQENYTRELINAIPGKKFTFKP